MAHNPPQVVRTPPDTWSLRDSLKLSLLEVFASNSSAAATLRWRQINARQSGTCGCGALGTVRVTDFAGDWAGSTPPYWWRCAEHAHVPLTVPWRGTPPALGEDRADCSWRSGSIDDPTIDACGCGTHVGERWGR